uniref:Uncharacterized protein MANES_08G151700 n=1 Tax=Rhizophora mucronata TaxID=61149 RepID=A0A2P2JQ34_RHIMU
MNGGTTRFLVFLTVIPTPLLHHRCPSTLRLSRHHRLPPSLCSLSHRRHYHYILSTLTTSVTHSLKPKATNQEFHAQTAAASPFAGSASSPPAVCHPWPEWSNLIENLYYAGYFSIQEHSIDIDGLVAGSGLTEDFQRAASACLSFASDKPGILGMLSRRDIEIIVANGTPFLFKNGDDSVNRMRLFLGGGDCSVSLCDLFFSHCYWNLCSKIIGAAILMFWFLAPLLKRPLDLH